MDTTPPELLINILKYLPGDDLSAMKKVNKKFRQLMHKNRKSLPPQKPWVDITVRKEEVRDRVPRQILTITFRQGSFNVYFGYHGIVYNRDTPLTYRFFREYDRIVAKLPDYRHFHAFFTYLFVRVNINLLNFETPLFSDVEKPFNELIVSSGCIVKNVLVSPNTWVIWDEIYESYLLVIGDLPQPPKLRIMTDDTWFKQMTRGSHNKIHYLNHLGERYSETVVQLKIKYFHYAFYQIANVWSNPSVIKLNFKVVFEGEEEIKQEDVKLQETSVNQFLELDIASNIDFSKPICLCCIEEIVLRRSCDKKQLCIKVNIVEEAAVLTFSVNE